MWKNGIIKYNKIISINWNNSYFDWILSAFINILPSIGYVYYYPSKKNNNFPLKIFAKF